MDKNGTASIWSMDTEETSEWILTYADLVTLLLVFFVLLFSISSLNLEKFKYAMKSIQVNLGESSPQISLMEILDTKVLDPMDQETTIEDITGLKSREDDMLKEFGDLINKKQLNENIVLYASRGKIMLQIRGAVLFGSGAAAFNKKARPILDQISKIIDGYPEYNVNIKGHTDNVPILTKQFPSNWELSSIRATTVLKYLIKNGISPNRLTATGYSDLLPIAPNNSEKNRAKNRRVEFVLEKKKDAF